MNIHRNARLTPLRREEMAVAVIGGRLTKAQAARLYGVSLKIVSRWTERFRMSVQTAMMDRSSRPPAVPVKRTELLLNGYFTFADSVSPASTSPWKPVFLPPPSAVLSGERGCRG